MIFFQICFNFLNVLFIFYVYDDFSASYSVISIKCVFFTKNQLTPQKVIFDSNWMKTTENNGTNTSFKSQLIKGFNEFVAGSLGGMAGIAVGHPMDTIRVRLQIQSPINPKYKSFSDCFLKILKEENGVRGLFKGLLSPLLGEMGNLAVVFGIYGNLKKYVSQDDYIGIAISGLIAGVTAVSVVVPVELVKIRVQTNSKEFKGFYGCLREILQQPGGMKNLYHGLSVTLVRDIPFNVSYFVSYEYIKNQISKRTGKVSTTEYLLSGGLAGMCAWAIIYPTDILKSIIQAETKKIKILPETKRIYQTEGIRGFYKGYTISVLRAFPVNAVTFLGYEFVVNFLNKMTDKYVI